MTKKIFASSLCLMALVFASCGSSKKATADNYYNEPVQRTAQPTLKKREVRELSLIHI